MIMMFATLTLLIISFNSNFSVCEYMADHDVGQGMTLFDPLRRMLQCSYEPRHDKTNKMSVRPAKIQISLGIRTVWSESSLSAWRNLGSLATHWAHNEDSDQTARMPGWSESSLGAHSFCLFCHVAAHNYFLGAVNLWLQVAVYLVFQCNLWRPLWLFSKRAWNSYIMVTNRTVNHFIFAFSLLRDFVISD